MGTVGQLAAVPGMPVLGHSAPDIYGGGTGADNGEGSSREYQIQPHQRRYRGFGAAQHCQQAGQPRCPEHRHAAQHRQGRPQAWPAPRPGATASPDFS